MAGIKIICENRAAFHNYSIEERWEAGLVLVGTEVKALRDAKGNLRDAYAVLKGGQLYLLNCHIGPYTHGNRENHEPLRSRKLLLHRAELNKLWSKMEIKGYSLLPLKLYFKEGVVKAELGLGKGKKLHDKRAASKERDEKRNMDKLRKSMR